MLKLLRTDGDYGVVFDSDDLTVEKLPLRDIELAERNGININRDNLHWVESHKAGWYILIGYVPNKIYPVTSLFGRKGRDDRIRREKLIDSDYSWGYGNVEVRLLGAGDYIILVDGKPVFKKGR